MLSALDVARIAGDVAHGLARPERRQVVILAALNVGAAALALAALHIGGAVVSRGSDAPAVISDAGASTSAPKTSTPAVPRPHLAPRFAAMPDKTTLFSPPVVSPGTFAGEIGAASSGFAPAPSPAATPAAQSHAANLAPVTATPHLAATAHHTEIAALAQAVGPLAMTDAMLDAAVDGAATIGNVSASVADGTGVTSAVAATAATATSTVASVASSVGGAVGGGVASVGGTVGGVASSVGGAVGGVAAAAGAH